MFIFESLDEQTIKLQDGYRWLSIIRCRIASDNSNEFGSIDFFNDLKASPAYHNTYLEPGSWREDSRNAHGPFAINRINSYQYHALSKSEFTEDFLMVFNDISYYFNGPTKDEAEKVNQFLSSFSEHVNYYKFERQHLPARLIKGEYEFDFEWSFVLWEFVEFIAIDPREKLLYFLVFGFD